MNIFRTAQLKDIAQIAAITAKAGHGLTTIPKSVSGVEAYVEETLQFLAGDKTANRILFVAESGGQIQGISGIIPKLGISRPFYSFKRSAHTRRSHNPPLSVTINSLQLSTEFDDYTELASIFLSPDARGKGLGRLLSLGRLCFIQRHRDLFHDSIMADIRGWTDEAGQSPFWNGLTSKFIDMSYEEADRMSAIDGSFINMLIPSLPILLNMLPGDVSQCSGRAHEKSQGALRLLLEAGFERTDFCDVFDGGPSIRAKFGATLISQTAQPYAAPRQFTSDKPCLHFSGAKESFIASLGPDDAKTAKRFQGLQAAQPAQPEQPAPHWVAQAYPSKTDEGPAYAKDWTPNPQHTNQG